MDGSSRTLLHNTDLTWPNALAIDYANQQLYWLDAGLDKMETSKADGSNRVLLTTTNIFHPFDVTFYQGLLFWSDWLLNAIVAAPVNNINSKTIIFGNLTLDPMGIEAACTSRQELGIKELHGLHCDLLWRVSFVVANPCDGQHVDERMCLLSTNSRGFSSICADSHTTPIDSAYILLLTC